LCGQNPDIGREWNRLFLTVSLPSAGDSSRCEDGNVNKTGPQNGQIADSPMPTTT
jgi:hypothetical protein